jgi:hypothetical protein
MMIQLRILGCKRPQRYALLRVVTAAVEDIRREKSDLQVEISQVSDSQEILKYTQVLSYPSLMINDRLVCCGRTPRKEEVVQWLCQ